MTAENGKKTNPWLWVGCGVVLVIFVLALGVISIVAYKEGCQRLEAMIEKVKTEAEMRETEAREKKIEEEVRELERERQELEQREQEESEEELNQ